MKLQQLDVGQGIRRAIGFSKRKKKRKTMNVKHMIEIHFRTGSSYIDIDTIWLLLS